MWLVWAGTMNKIMFLSFAHCKSPTDMWDLCPFNRRRAFWSAFIGTYFKKCSSRYSRNSSQLDHPESKTLPTAPGVAPSIKSVIILLPAKMRKGGIAVPVADPHPIKVVVQASPAVTASGVIWLPHTTGGAEWFWENPFSSMLYIKWGSLSKPWSLITCSNSWKYLSTTEVDAHLALAISRLLGFNILISGHLLTKPRNHLRVNAWMLPVPYTKLNSIICCNINNLLACLTVTIVCHNLQMVNNVRLLLGTKRRVSATFNRFRIYIP